MRWHCHLRPLSPLLGKPKRLALGLPHHCGVWAGEGSTPSSLIGKPRPRVPRWGPRRKKTSKQPFKRPAEVTHDPSRVRRPAPFSVSHPQPAAFTMETVLPPSSAPPFLQCTLENAVHLWLPSGMSLLHVLKGLQVPEGCALTPTVSGGYGLDRETQEPAGGARRVRGRHPPMGGLLGGPRVAIGHGSAEEAGSAE